MITSYVVWRQAQVRIWQCHLVLVGAKQFVTRNVSKTRASEGIMRLGISSAN
jgi:hypothetical protein